MKIAITADPQIPVPPVYYGGIERIIHLLVTELCNQGHEVTLFAHSDSKVCAKLIGYPSPGGNGRIDHLQNSWTINKTILSKKFDLIHSFGRLSYLLPMLPLSIPKLMSYQREPTISQIKKATYLSQKNSLWFTGCSNYITDKIKPHAPAYAIYNAVEMNKYIPQFELPANAPLVFLGRIEPIKGTHIAIQAAIKTGKTLVIAGNISPEHQDYFDQKIKPFLNASITYIGPVNDHQKNELLRNSSALLMPIEWDEPFGIVMAEALACGTPVIGFKRGAVPEIVKHGINGFICSTVDEMAVFINRLPEINRIAVRMDAEARFSSEVMVSQYLKIYANLINYKRSAFLKP
ncbi:MAG: glycosyltransferase family 4 protein [Candidatus Pedobacter colombiensis]|uniref:Glycosyltransferase family 4 protein n=1 Tax=Candidatus Pedobacter colombiensis TaxID=3121371 RepID=A0AAJ6B911_9SPHI|nr:glycosyltransferase family 4 protein [Pedobacter sp.]WEK19698.1 MAG: glycosyltransferase family 4 protein [Pedobacter sp.]